MLGAAESNSLGAETDRSLGVRRGIGVRAHAKAAHLVGPADQSCEFAGQLRFDHFDLAGQHLSGRAVDGDVVTLFEALAASSHGPRSIVDAQ